MMTAGLPRTAGISSYNRAILDDLERRASTGLADALGVLVPAVTDEPVPLRGRAPADVQVHVPEHAGALAGAHCDRYAGHPVHFPQGRPDVRLHKMLQHIEAGHVVEAVVRKREAMSLREHHLIVKQIGHHLGPQHGTEPELLGKSQRLAPARAHVKQGPAPQILQDAFHVCLTARPHAVPGRLVVLDVPLNFLVSVVSHRQLSSLAIGKHVRADPSVQLITCMSRFRFAHRAYCAKCIRRLASLVLLRPLVYGPKKCVPCMSKPSSRIRLAPFDLATSRPRTPLLTDT